MYNTEVKLTSARNVQFSVVSFGKNVKVKINNKNYDLKKVNNYTPLFKASINVGNNTTIYQYIEDNKTESFNRSLNKDKTKTDNDFYGKKDTVKKLPQFPILYEWKRSVGKGVLFDDSYIPTVHIYGTNSQKFFKIKIYILILL
ncbi:hypothetical protein BCR32DRAFT_267720 [Anaeromyces robustus]|uniref:Uncharacterized protein n=1 Tax=Anaeromyces robustus TaxID=1754192 RepID=A0A1Y1X9C4_9FUNG|nr:hypothetical protein BCR32DRAFT_267720 [Anaeromyces robustus]|eukprot:ORX82337.1 hypothetical protein BCR32DRAFT_267720 [Anaeromyces robustus]